MAKKLRFLFTLLFVMAATLSWGQTSYKLEQVTSVEADGLYVFEQDGYVMNNTVSSNALQTTNSYNTTGLAGTETYVWTLESANGGFYMKNVRLSSNNYLNNASGKTNISLGSKSSIWAFNFQTDNTVLIQNTSNSNRFLGYTDEINHVYKAYATSNLSSYSHAINVYKLVEEEVGTIAAPTFSPAAGEVDYGTTVTLTQNDAEMIMYTTDGTDPSYENENGELYSESKPIAITSNTTIKAIAIDGDGNESDVATAAYTVKKPDAPTFNPTSGSVEAGAEITLSANVETIIYTTDGTTPSYANNVGEIYTTPISINETTTIKAISVDGGGNESDVAEETYTIIPAGAEYVTLWSEDFSSYSQGDVPNGGIYSYNCTNGGGTTRVYDEALADGSKPELLVAKNNGSFTAVVPLKNVVGDLTLTYKTNAYSLNVYTTTEGIEGSITSTTARTHSVTFKGITANTTSITIVFKATTGSNVRLDDIVLTGLQLPSAVKTPVISLASGTYFGTQSVRITCETADAKIYYTLDGTEPTSASTLYTSAIPISETTTLKAIAIKDNESSNVATAEYTIAPTYENNNAANVAATITDSPVRLTLTEALVVYKNGNNTYLKDASGGMLIYGENNLNVGDKVTGHVDGDLTLYNGLPEIKNPVFSVSTVSQNNEVTATVVDAADLKANPMKYVSQYVKVSPAKFAEDFTGSTSNATNANFTVGETELILRNSFKLGVEVSKDKDYAISGMATIFIKDGETNVQLYPTNTDSDIEELHFVAQVGEQKYGTLQEAVDVAYAMTGDVIVELLDNISGYSIVHQKAGLNLTIDGKDKIVDGQIIIDGDGRLDGTETLTITNIKFKGDKTNLCPGTDAFIIVPSTKDTGKPYTTGKYNYAHNVTVDKCSFTSTSSALDVVAVKANSNAGLRNVIVTNNIGTNLHSLAQLTGTEGGTIKNNTVDESDSFVNVSGGNGEFEISGNKFVSKTEDGYAVRENAGSSAILNLSDNDFTAFKIVQLGKSKSATNGTINVVSGRYVGSIVKDIADNATGKIVVSGGLFSVRVADEYCAEGKICAANPDEETKANYPYIVRDGQYTAQVGDQKFETFVDAVAAVTEENNVITLLANVTEGYTIAAGKALNVNLNGFTLTVIAPEGYLLKTEEKDGVTTYSAIAPVAQIGDVKYETIAAAVAAAEEGQTVKVIKGGEYTLPGIAKNITIEGAEEIEVLFTHTAAGSIASIPNGATFKNVKFEFGNVNYHGFQHAGTINMEGCTLSGKLFSYGDMNFTNCQFVQTNSDYHMWTYSGNVTYTDCTFTNEKTGKFINVYNESGATKYTVTATNCEFINKEGNAANKAAINVKATCGEKLLVYDVIINNCTTKGAFPEANVTQPLAILNNLVQVDDRTEDGVDNITVTHDGEQIYPIRNYVAQVGETKYETLREALDAAKDNENIVVELLADAELDITAWDGEKNALSIGSINTKSITINGNNHTLTFNQKNSDWNNVATMNDSETKLILNDMAITNSGYNNGPWNRHDINFNCAVELNNVTSDKALAFKNDATLKNVTVTDTGDIYGIWISPRKAGQNVSIDGLTVTCARGIKVDDEYVDNPEKVTLDIKNATFNTTKKSAILVKSKAETAITVGEDVNIENVAADKVNTVWVDEDYAEEFYKVSVEGATVVPESKETDYVACLMKGDQRWGFYKKLSTAIDKVEEGYGIKLFQTTTEAVTVAKTLTIVKNGFTADNVTAGEGFVRIETDTEIKIISTSAIPTTPVVFHDSGEYEAGLSVPMYAQVGEIYYTIGESTEAKKYTGPLTINEDTKITAWSELNGVKSAVVTREYTIKAAAAEIEAIDGYYSIKNNDNEKYINVAGRKTVTFVADGDEADKAGTVLKVKINTKGQVEELRSQGVDLPGYADRAMNYVPKFVKLIVDKLHAEGSGEILGEHGLDAIMQKFNDSFDYHLYIENANGGYRIYGKTPSMKPVVDFYAGNKDNVDYKLPQLEAFINSAIQKVLQKTGGRGSSILTKFKLHDIWQKMGSKLTEPEDEASTAKFYEEVLSSEANVWNFAYQTAMIYWNNVKNHPRYEELKGKLGEYANYIEKVENIQPDFKYYIVGNTSGNGVDFISEGNTDIQNNADRTIWTMNERNDYKVTFTKENSLNIGRELYTTLYVDFAYTLPETVKAYKVTAIDEKTGLATKEEITGVIPAQTPVLLQMIVDPKTVTDADLTQALTLSTEAGSAVAGNLLQGPEWLINKDSITAKQVEDLFGYVHDFLKLADVEALYDSYVKEYEYLMMRNAGTVNNKYFFGLSGDDIADADVNVCQLAKQGNTRKRLAFYHNLEKVDANKAFIPSEKVEPVYLSLIGDVNRDGYVNITDVTCQIDIVLGKDKPEDNYDYDAADLDGNDEIRIDDVTDLIDVVLGKKTIE